MSKPRYLNEQSGIEAISSFIASNTMELDHPEAMPISTDVAGLYSLIMLYKKNASSLEIAPSIPDGLIAFNEDKVILMARFLPFLFCDFSNFIKDSISRECRNPDVLVTAFY